MQKKYVTTAINYTNGPPHIGHAYEGVTADVISRYYKVAGYEAYFLTGTDEHGQKIADVAASKGVTPKELCDTNSQLFKDLNDKLHVVPNRFIRTTDEDHHEVARSIWRTLTNNSFIYKGTYKGWYNVREETFVTEREAQTTEYKDPETGKPLTVMEEESYFFAMSKFQTRLVDHIKANPEFIQPVIRKNEILKRLEEPLEDLSVSRATFDWGIPVPEDEKHVMYVWIDALTNYYTASRAPGLDYLWPADVHIIGKDIIWFHTVIWPTILMGADIELPHSVVAHGFVMASNGRKMAKSLGNVVDPNDLLLKYDSDTIRYYLCKCGNYGMDVKFDEDALTGMHNSDLCDAYGNLVHRGFSLCCKSANAKIPPFWEGADVPLPFDMDATFAAFNKAFDAFQLEEAVAIFVGACTSTNKFLTTQEPWKMKGTPDKQKHVLRLTMEAIYVLSILGSPFIPKTTSLVFQRIHTQPKALTLLSPLFDNLALDGPVSEGAVLFTKF